MPLPPLRNPSDPARAWVRGSIGSARVWEARERSATPQAPPVEDLLPPHAVASPPEPAVEPGEDARSLQELELRHPALARRLRQVLVERSNGVPHADLLERILTWVDASPEPAAPRNGATPSAVDAAELELLERRLSKLRTSLHGARDLRRRLLRMDDHDPGIASIYRAVQGLALRDGLAKVKRELLREIFEANLAFQKRPA